ncbi:complex I NDUFA9 subunit family protein [Halarchaeum sp. CBA1220]|uniref:complex I NDUFA9 subunit family protein n=1 Tax=Halarchaeum sp. CBA1220 TaxID=1853682 RepID=UPI000F3A9F94|nr:complex I NDUFA9 subunit family protein [Halarchaeum sp. CBA1220]QLC33046.1 complex I NDUFA9 subunit family protein [Halarchaeum sp. CBA1220]
MKVLVTGGTGFIGTHLCRELVERGHDVTALARTPNDDGVPEGVEAVTGDVTAYDSMEGAFEGQDAVVHLVALSPLFKPKGGDERHFEVHLQGTENVVRAAEAHDVRKLVQLSALGADPDGETAYVRAKGQAEAAVRESDLAWTILRPSVVFGEGGEFVSFTRTLTTPYVTALPGGGKTRFQPIWVGDLVGVIADALKREHDGETYEVGGPEVLSLADVATQIYRAEGKSLTVLSVPMGLAGVGMSMADAVPGVPFGRDQYRSLRFDNTVAENDVAAFGRDPADLKRLSEYLREP